MTDNAIITMLEKGGVVLSKASTGFANDAIISAIISVTVFILSMIAFYCFWRRYKKNDETDSFEFVAPLVVFGAICFFALISSAVNVPNAINAYVNADAYGAKKLIEQVSNKR